MGQRDGVGSQEFLCRDFYEGWWRADKMEGHGMMVHACMHACMRMTARNFSHNISRRNMQTAMYMTGGGGIAGGMAKEL